MLATFHRAPIRAAVGLFAVALTRMPRDHATLAPVAPPAVDGCPTAPIAVPPVIDSPSLIYISGPDRPIGVAPLDREPARY